MTDKPFVHLHCHTDYSLLDGACEIDQLMELVAAQKMPAVAMTDHGNLFGAVEFYNTAKAKGIHPVIGCEVYVSQQGHKITNDTDRYNHLVLLCENQEGYRNLIKLVSTGYLEGFYYKPRIDMDLLAQHSQRADRAVGLPARAHHGDPFSRSKLRRRAPPGPRHTQDLFGKDNFFLEIQDHGLNEDRAAHAAGEPALAGDRHSAGGHQRLALPAQGRRARARDPAVHPDRQDDERREPDALGHAGLLSQDRATR